MTENRRRKGRPRSLPVSGKEECSDDTIPPSKLTKVSDGDVSRGFHEEFDEVSLLEPYGQQDGNSDQIIPYSSSSSHHLLPLLLLHVVYKKLAVVVGKISRNGC